MGFQYRLTALGTVYVNHYAILPHQPLSTLCVSEAYLVLNCC